MRNGLYLLRFRRSETPHSETRWVPNYLVLHESRFSALLFPAV